MSDLPVPGTVNLLYHPAQEAFLKALAERNAAGEPAYHRLALLAGRRGGKSLGGALAVATMAAKPNQMIWACAPSFPKLHDYVLPALRQILPPDWITKWSEVHQEFTLVNGTVIQCRSLDDPERGRGPGLNGLWIDEMRDVPEKAWNTLLPALVDKRGVAWITSSPNGYDHVYRNFWKPATEGRPGYWAIRYKTSENPSIEQRDIDDARQSMDPEFFRQEFEADFVHFTGAVYGDRIDGQVIAAGNEKLVIPEWPVISSSRPSICTIDPGVDHPFGAAVCVMTEQGLVWVGEYLARHKAISEHVTAIRAMVTGLTPQYGYDRSARQVQIELAQHGIYAVPCENAVEAGIRRVEAWLQTARMWFLESRVPTMIDQMRSYRWANNVSLDGQRRIKERVFKVDDEFPDCFVAGTLITTERGDVPIEHVTLADRAWTRGGWRPVEAVFRLPEWHPTFVVKLSDGRTLRGTGNHKVWVQNRGWVELSQLRYGNMLLPCTQTITEAAHGPSGPSPTVLSPVSTISTTSTATHLTTTSATFPVFPGRPISHVTCSTDPPAILSVTYVDGMVQHRPPDTDSAPTPVNRNGEETQGSTTNSGPAPDVEWSFSPHDTQRHVSVRVPALGLGSISGSLLSEPAPSAVPCFSQHHQQQPSVAPTVVTSVSIADDAPVYNLTVSEIHEYFANGVLVANCVRYATMMWPEMPTPAESTVSVRKLDDLPDNVRWAVERERRLGAWTPETAESGVSDFYQW